ncbi:MAG TPA: class I SAM-dependent methyltransferase [candidate division Zixibacteria bacterium]|jgi:demethylmenaquinone methyltransferase/2-methoxy-6-polyprenyl-1,4-benzoquinol methylase
MSKKEYFDRYAHRWDQFYDLETKNKLGELVNSFRLEKGSQVLDLGCGTGILFPSILRAIGKKGRLFGVDFSPKMLLEARRKFQDVNIVLVCAPAENLPFLPESFDYVIAFASFPHFQSKVKAIGEIGRVMKKGGILFIAHLLGRKELKKHHIQSGDNEVKNDILPTKKALKRMLKSKGFKRIVILDQPCLYLVCGVK